MSLFEINTQTCTQDGLCAKECPLHIIKMSDSGPVPVKGAEDLCIRCGHCIAVCPVGAFSLEDLSADESLIFEKKNRISLEQAEQFLRSRRSIRQYKDKPVPKDLLEKAVRIASHAPSGNNYQPVKWLVFDKKEDVTQIGGHVIDWMRHMVNTQPEIAQRLNMSVLVDLWDRGQDRICRDAPHLVAAYASKEFGAAPADCHNALAYLELILPYFGLGSCWAGYVTFAVDQWQPLKEKFNLPDNHICHGVLMAGFPKVKYFRAPKRKTPDIRYHAG